MQEECKEFLAKTKQFNDIVGDFIDVMESKSKVIEAEKLRAIGLGNRVEHEKEVRKRKQLELQHWSRLELLERWSWSAEIPMG